MKDRVAMIGAWTQSHADRWRAYVLHRMLDTVQVMVGGKATINQVRVLTRVILESRFDDCATAGQIAIETGLSRSAVTRALHHWEKEGVIERCPHPTDDRVVGWRGSDESVERGAALRAVMAELFPEGT